MEYLIGIDIGTSGTKTVIFDTNGTTVASATKEYPLHQPQIGWAEQNPRDWWEAVCTSIREVIQTAGVKNCDIKGVGLSGQMHGLVMLDAEGNVLRPSIIWCDQRTAKECEEITDLVGRQKLIEITANPALTGFTASKIMWVRNNEPYLFEKCRKILLPKDYIRYMLTGEFATDVSDASGMQLLDIANRKWSDEVLNRLGIDRALLADVFESCVISATVSKNAAELTGLKEGTPVAGGAGDQAACAVGNGIVNEGMVSSTIGTSGVVFAHTDRPVIDKDGRVHTFCHAVPNAWHVMGVTQAAGLSLKWFRDNFCTSEMEVAKNTGVDPYLLMDKEADTVPAGSNGILYLPYLMGERSPHLNPDAKGVFFGLSAIHTKKDMLRAVMEGVGYSLKDCLNILREMDIEASEVRASGGGGRSSLWRQIQADMFGCNVSTTRSADAGTLGVAILAGVGTGIWNSVGEACEQVVKTKNAIAPIPVNKDIYEQGYKKYCELYHCIKHLF